MWGIRFLAVTSWGMATFIIVSVMGGSAAFGAEGHRQPGQITPTTDLRTLLKIGDSLLNLFENVRADSVFTRAIAIDSLSSEAYAGRGAARIPNSYKPQPAKQDLERAIKLDPNNLRAIVYRANLEVNLRIPDSAIADCNFVLSRDQGNIGAFLVRGRAHGGKGNFDAALADFGVVLMMDSTNCEAMVGVAGIRQEMGDQTGALEMYQRAIDRSRDARSWHLFIAHLRRGEIYDSRGWTRWRWRISAVHF